MEPIDYQEQTEPSIHETEQECCDTERLAAVSMAETTTNQKPMDDSKAGEPVYTSQWLRENTKIHGWLKFILYGYFPFCILCAVILFLQKILRGTPLSDFLFGSCINIILLFVPICLFQLRKPNAVFYAWLYLLFECLVGLDGIIYGITTHLATILQLVINITLIFYFELSKQVRNVIPMSFRKVSEIDRTVGWVLLTFLAIATLALWATSHFDYVVLIIQLLCLCLACICLLYLLSSEQKQKEIIKILREALFP